MSAPLAADVQTSPAQVCGCKGTTKFADVQENSEKIAIFWIMDAHEGYGTAFRLLEMGQYSYGTRY